jgi:hypothetical protein
MTNLTFTATPQQIENLLGQLKASGTQITQHTATDFGIEGHGIKAEATYADPTLTVAILSKPFYIPVSAIQNGIQEHLV